MNTILYRGLACVLALTLAACGGGGDGDSGDRAAGIDPERAADQLESIVEEADALLASRVVGDWSLRVLGVSTRGGENTVLHCAGLVCREAGEGFSIEIDEVFESDMDVSSLIASHSIGSRRGFHTGMASVALDFDQLLADEEVTLEFESIFAMR